MRRVRVAAALAIAGAVASGAPAVAAPSANADARVSFDIPAQPLDNALAQYFRLTGVQLLYDSSMTAGRRSNSVRGAYSPREALKRLLSGTGLSARYSRSNAAVLVAAEAARPATLLPVGRVVVRERLPLVEMSMRERYRAYYMMLEHALQSQLRRDKRAGRLSAEMMLLMRIDPGGRVTEVRADSPAKDEAPAATVATILLESRVPAPPAALPQPIAVSVKAR